MNEKLTVMQDGAELVRYDMPGVLLYIRKRWLSTYFGMRADCHWHEELELIYVLDGSMNYHVNGKQVRINASEGILVNSRVMHYGSSIDGEDCLFLCILFHPGLLKGSPVLYKKYVEPFLDDRLWEFQKLSGEEDEGLSEQICRIWEISKNRGEAHEMEILGGIYALWPLLFKHFTDLSEALTGDMPPDVLTMRKLVSYVHEHYAEAITLDELCRYGGVGKSTCFSLFKKHTSQSPMEFVNQYRLRTAANLLVTTDKTVTEVALSCGFNHHSYFTKQFRRVFGCTPGEVKKRKKGLDNRDGSVV